MKGPTTTTIAAAHTNTRPDVLDRNHESEGTGTSIKAEIGDEQKKKNGLLTKGSSISDNAAPSLTPTASTSTSQHRYQSSSQEQMRTTAVALLDHRWPVFLLMTSNALSIFLRAPSAALEEEGMACPPSRVHARP